MGNLTKDQVLTAASIVLLLITALVEWTVYSWLILVSIILLLVAWYFKKD